MKAADEWTRAHTIGHNRSAKEAERKLWADRMEAFLANGGEIDVRDAAGNRMVDGAALPRHASYSMADKSRKGGQPHAACAALHCRHSYCGLGSRGAHPVALAG